MAKSIGNGTYVRDLVERVLVTATQGAVAEVVIAAANWPQWVAVPALAGLAVVKGWLAKLVGNKDSASLAPGV